VTNSQSVVLVTGGAGGMAVACAPRMAAIGHVVLTDLDVARLEPAEQAVAAGGGRSTSVACDLRNDRDVAVLVETVTSIGALRAVVHTAGISPMMADGPTVLDVDLVSTARLFTALEPYVCAGTAAVCIASIAGHSDLASEANAHLDDPLAPGFLDTIADALDIPLDGAAGYVLAKRGVIRLCERLAGPWGARGGRIVSISPGLIDTEMGRFEYERQEMMKAMAEFTPVQRERESPLPGLPEDIAATVAFLCSDDAAFISGCDIRVDGGLIGAGRSLGLAG